MKIIMTTLFGIEALTADELQELGYSREQIEVKDGQVILDVGDELQSVSQAIGRLNIFLATAERVLLEVATFPARTFDELFEAVKIQPWDEWITRGFAFQIKGYSRKSELFGISACQSLIKKAIVQSILQARGQNPDSTLEEDREAGLIQIQFSIIKDQVSLMIDTSGTGLHKRGYRPLLHEAPIRETLAAAMIRVSRYNPQQDEALFDPCCGSGTLPIEAALLAGKIAPGKDRSFSAEKWPVIGTRPFTLARTEAIERESSAGPQKIVAFGSDISPKAVEISANNARRAGVAVMIKFRQADIFTMQREEIEAWTGFRRHLIICNPPYGDRLLDDQQAEKIISRISQIFLDHGRSVPGYRLSVISPQENFEQLAGGKADKRRKLHNGMIRCTLFHYFRHRRFDRQ